MRSFPKIYIDNNLFNNFKRRMKLLLKLIYISNLNICI